MKVKYKDKLKEFRKSVSSNILMIAGIFALDLLVIMVDVNLSHTNNTNTELTTLISNWAVATYLILFALLIFAYISLNKANYKTMRRVMLAMLLLTIFNLATFIYAGYIYSLMLLVPILMLVYMREKAKAFVH